MPGIATGTVAKQAQGIVMQRFTCGNENGSGFTHVDAVARRRKRASDAGGQDFQRGKPVQCQQGQGIHAAANDRIRRPAS